MIEYDNLFQDSHLVEYQFVGQNCVYISNSFEILLANESKLANLYDVGFFGQQIFLQTLWKLLI